MTLRKGRPADIWHIFCFFLLSSTSICNSQTISPERYNDGDPFSIQCMTKEGEWGPGPICQETGKEMEFHFGVDTFQFCGWPIESIEHYRHLAAMITRVEDWDCRVKMGPKDEFYLPFNFPMWGIVEGDHIHIDNHMNFLFHANEGKIIGVTAYPVRDNFQFLRPGSVVTIHGPIKWFRGGTFMTYSSNMFMETEEHRLLLYVVVLVLTCVITYSYAALIYKCYLQPSFVKSLLRLKHQKQKIDK